MKVVIVGGVAGGASCAARLRRLDENAEIVMVERGPYVSYANCGLPYHVGGVIEKESSLLVANAATFRASSRSTRVPAARRWPSRRRRRRCSCATSRPARSRTESYDKLVLSPGATSVRPPLPGIDLPGIFQVRTVPDARAIREWIERGIAVPRRACTSTPASRRCGRRPGPSWSAAASSAWRRPRTWSHRGFEVTLIENGHAGARPARRRDARASSRAFVQSHGVRLALGDGVAGFKQADGGAIDVETKSGKVYPADVVILALGVRPDTTLAKAAGLDDRRARRHPRRRPDAHQRPGHLRGRRCGRGQGLRHRRVEPGRAGRPGQPAGPHRRRRDRRPRLALPRHAGHLDHRPVRRGRGVDRAPARRRSSGAATRITRRSTCSRTRTPATIPARSRSR